MSEFPTTENGISMLVNAEWHAPQCNVNRTRQYMDCDCSLSRAIAATEQEAIRRAEERPAVRDQVTTENVGRETEQPPGFLDFIRTECDQALGPESRSETVRRAQREGGGDVTAVMVSRGDETPA
jgi:hypothetical protein